MKDGLRGGERKKDWEKEQMEINRMWRRCSERGVKEVEERRTRRRGQGRVDMCQTTSVKEGRKRRGRCGCVWEKAFQTTSVIRATSVMTGREERRREDLELRVC